MGAMRRDEAEALVETVLGPGYVLDEHPRGWLVSSICLPGRRPLGSVATWVVSAEEEALVGFPPHVSRVLIREQFDRIRPAGWVQAVSRQAVPA